MAIIANCRQPDSDYVTVDRVPSPLAQVLPVPMLTAGIAVDVDFGVSFTGIANPYTKTSAVTPESTYLEPTTGQIWPR